MHLWWISMMFLYQFQPVLSGWFFPDLYHPWIEKYHYPGYFTTAMTIYINGTDTEIQSTYYTPDYRVEEKMYVVYGSFTKEQERPYRITPLYKQIKTWETIRNGINVGCYMLCVYRRYVVLSGGALITTRHVLTTANPTILILRAYGHLKTLEGILGGWYEINADVWNASLYMTPARIHIHPLYKYDYEVNVSHPIPVMYDLSVWAATYRFYGSWWSYSMAIICYRAASGWWEYASTIPRRYDLSGFVGSLFMKSYKRRPLPWYKFIVFSKAYVWPCPKSDWHWFHCVMGEYWGRFGFDSGGAMHMFMERKSNRIDGFAAMCSFSLKLRAFQTTHYFTVVDTYPVLDFFYDAFLGLQKYAYLDARFQDTKWAAPVPWWGEYIYVNYNYGWQYDYGYVHNYR